MKRILALLLCLTMLLSFTACGSDTKKKSEKEDKTPVSTSSNKEQPDSFDENNIGEVYFHQTEIENIVTEEDGVMYAGNELLLVASNNATHADIEKLAKGVESTIVGRIEQTGDYQLQLSQTHTREELEQIASLLKNSEYVQEAYVNFAFATYVTRTTERNGFIYGEEWEKDLQNFNNCKGKSWGLEAINTFAAWDWLNAYKSNVNPVKVGLIDSGFDVDHEDLGFAEVFYNAGVAEDRLGHGTHVAGTMAAKANNNEGICGIYPYGDGNLYGVSYVGIGAYSENGDVFTTSMFLKIAYSELILRNVKIINTSLGFNYYDWPLQYTDPQWSNQVAFLESNAHILGDFLNRLLQEGYDFVLVTSAGNDSDRVNGVIYESKYNFWTTVIAKDDYPDVYDRIVVVGAVDSDFEICNFSNSAPSGKEDRVDIYAPGDIIFSTTPNDGYSKTYKEDGETYYWSGTSMAAPHVSGVAAMVWSVNNRLTGKQVKDIICSHYSSRGKGCHIINAYTAMQAATSTLGDSTGTAPANSGILCWVASVENTNTKVPNATVSIISTATNAVVDTVTTDSQGHFEAFLPAGEYVLLVTADGYEDYRWSEPITVTNNAVNYLDDWIKMTPTYDSAVILGTYKGSYFASQGETGLTLTVYKDEDRYEAVFDFYNLPGQNNSESGKFLMDVSYNIDTGEYEFVATEWVVQPPLYGMGNLKGKLSGDTLSGESPTRFSVTKVTEGDSDLISLEDMPIIAHDSYQDNEGDSTIFNLGADGLTQNDDGHTFMRYGNIGVDGTVYNDGFEVWIARWNYTDEISWASATFDLGGKYKHLTGKTGLIQSYNTSTFDTTIYFYDGDKLLASYRLTDSDYIKNIAVDVTGVKELTLYVHDNVAVSGGTSFALYDMFLDADGTIDGQSDVLSFNGHYYQVFDLGLTWEEARIYCQNLGGHLVTITSEGEQNKIEELMEGQTKNSYWIGAQKQNESYSWITGESFNYTNWAYDQPDNNQKSGGEDKLHLYRQSNPRIRSALGEWNDLNGDGTCGDETFFGLDNFGFVCEWDSLSAMQNPPQQVQSIPSDAITYSDHHYKIYSNVCSTWEEAKEYCESLGGHLAIISSQEENDALFSYLTECGYDTAYFGLYQNENSEWVWVNGDTSSYLNWHTNEPSNDTGEDYAEFYWKFADGTWNDGNFSRGTQSDSKNFICEWD